MHVVTRRRLKEFGAIYPDADLPLDRWFKIAKKAWWTGFADVRADFGTQVDQYGPLQIFDIGGNKYRLIVRIVYRIGKVYIRHVLTHADYSLGKWKLT